MFARTSARTSAPLGALALLVAWGSFAAAQPKGPPFYDPERSLKAQDEAAKEAKEQARTGGVEQVVPLLADASVAVREAVLEVLVGRNDERLLAGLERYLGHREEFIAAQVAELYGLTRYAKGREALERYGLRSKSEMTVLESIWALQALGDAQAAKALEKTFQRRHPASEFRVQGDALIALAHLDPKRAREHVANALTDKRPPLVIAGLVALQAIEPAAAARAAVDVIAAKPMDRKLAGWEGRLLFAALETLERWPERDSDRELAVSAVDALIARLAREEDGLPKHKVALALAELTGEPLGDDPSIWSGWWGPRKGSFTFPAKQAPAEEAGKGKKKAAKEQGDGPGRPETGGGGTRVRFHGIPIYSTRILFAQDVSGGMRNPVDKDVPGSPAKMDFANTELKRVLAALHERVLTNVAFFATDCKFTAERVVPIGKVRHQLIEFVDRESTAPDGYGMNRSNLYDTIVAGMSDPDIDTIYFLSEGGPNEGLFVESTRFMRHLTRLNVYTRVQVQCLQVTASNYGQKFLRALAAGTGGEYYDLEFLKKAHGLK